jgi:peptidoglycan/xylan/chitin deacetylase (PgdA/CDA1 family)
MTELSAFEAWLVRLGSSLLSGRGRSASLLVLIYHRVLAQPDDLLPDEPDAARFSAQMDLLARNFNTLPLREAVARLRSRSLPERTVCVTFDDGYANNHDVALPILTAHRIPATVFVAPGYLNGKRMFNDTVLETLRRAPRDAVLRAAGLEDGDQPAGLSRGKTWEHVVASLKYLEPAERLRRAEALAENVGVSLPTDLMMTDAQVCAMHRAGVEIGAHTMTHPILTRVAPEVARREIAASKQTLQEMIGADVRSFAYPNGRPVRDYDRTHVALVAEAGFELAVSSAWGAATAQSDRMQIPRVGPWDRGARRYAARLAGAYRQRRFETA